MSLDTLIFRINKLKYNNLIAKRV